MCIYSMQVSNNESNRLGTGEVIVSIRLYRILHVDS